MTIGERVKNLRIDKKLSVLKLSNELLVNEAAIRSWELNKTEPKASSILALAKFFDVSADYLLGLEDEYGNKYR